MPLTNPKLESETLNYHLRFSFDFREMESNIPQKMPSQNLNPVGIIKEAIIVLIKKTDFIIFTAITSLPLFCCLVYFENLFLNILVTISEILQRDRSENLSNNWPISFELLRKFDQNFAYQLIQLCSLYLIPLPLLELGAVLSIVGPASKLLNQGKAKENPIDAEISFRGVLVTFVYAFLLTTFTLVGLIWLVMMYFVVPRLPMCDVLIVIVFLTAFGLVLKVYLECKSFCLMSVVISIVDGVYGVEAIVLSTRFNRGNERCGFVLMLLFFVFGVSLRLPCIFFGCFETELWVIAQIGLVCFGNVVQWIALVVYCRGCKNRFLEKEISDEAIRKDIEVVHV